MEVVASLSQGRTAAAQCGLFTHKSVPVIFEPPCTWSYTKVRELIAVKVLHTSLLNTTVVAFKVLPLGSYAPMPASSPTFKKFCNRYCGMAFRAALVLILTSSMSSKCLPFNISFIFGKEKSHWGLDPVNRQGVQKQLFV